MFEQALNTLHLKLRNVGRHTALKLSPHIVFVFLPNPSALLDRTIQSIPFQSIAILREGTGGQLVKEVQRWDCGLIPCTDGFFFFYISSSDSLFDEKEKKKRLCLLGFWVLVTMLKKKAFLLYFLLYLFIFSHFMCLPLYSDFSGTEPLKHI